MDEALTEMLMPFSFLIRMRDKTGFNQKEKAHDNPHAKPHRLFCNCMKVCYNERKEKTSGREKQHGRRYVCS